MLLYGSISIAVGAACNDLKDAQNLMLPVMLPLTMPMLLLTSIVEAPSSPLATAISLFPPATPIILLLRLGLQPTLPGWQIAVGVAGTLLTTAVCVWAAGRIFRIGLLLQGRSARLGEMLRWLVRD
jgi:ABC-type Na+ efflux pump permease subunit